MSEGYYVPPMSKKDLLKAARQLRKKLGMEKTLFFDIVSVIEGLSYKGKFDFLVVDDRELPGAYACYDPTENSLKVRDSVYVDACNGNGRHRFTLAHELAHWLIHGDKVAYARSVTPDIPIYCNSEWQADTLASMILMDPDLISDLSIETIVSKCGVSYSAANIAKNKKLS